MTCCHRNGCKEAQAARAGTAAPVPGFKRGHRGSHAGAGAGVSRVGTAVPCAGQTDRRLWCSPGGGGTEVLVPSGMEGQAVLAGPGLARAELQG